MTLTSVTGLTPVLVSFNHDVTTTKLSFFFVTMADSPITNIGNALYDPLHQLNPFGEPGSTSITVTNNTCVDVEYSVIGISTGFGDADLDDLSVSVINTVQTVLNSPTIELIEAELYLPESTDDTYLPDDQGQNAYETDDGKIIIKRMVTTHLILTLTLLMIIRRLVGTKSMCMG